MWVPGAPAAARAVRSLFQAHAAGETQQEPVSCCSPVEQPLMWAPRVLLQVCQVLIEAGADIDACANVSGSPGTGFQMLWRTNSS
jgi:hypothetical protein